MKIYRSFKITIISVFSVFGYVSNMYDLFLKNFGKGEHIKLYFFEGGRLYEIKHLLFLCKFIPESIE
jgi:hypothetical protein